MSKKKKKFKRQNAHKHDRVSESWRKPRGKHSPMRRKEGHAPKMPNKGFRSPEDVRGLHPSGLEDVLVHTPSELDDLDSDTHAVRIGSSVGGRKRAVIAAKAEEQELHVLNYTEAPEAEDADIEDAKDAEADGEDTDTDADSDADNDTGNDDSTDEDADDSSDDVSEEDR